MDKKNIIITEENKLRAEKQILEEIKHYDYDTVEYPIEVLVDLYHNGLNDDGTPNKENLGEIHIPDYQREYTWDDKRKSKFIESVILGIPIPYIFFADVEGKYEIVDGSQRIRTLHSFIKKNELILQSLEKLNELNGFKFSDLSDIRQRRILRKSLKMIALSEKTVPEARFDLFERINTGSDLLTYMEVRKGAYSGPFYDFINECSQNELFKKLCPISKNRTYRAEPQEMVLRFFAYSDGLNEYKNNVRPFIDKYMKKMDKKFNSELNLKMQNDFIEMLVFVNENFVNGFAKVKNATSTPRVRFEAIAVGVRLALNTNPKLKVKNIDWLESTEFKKIIRSDAANNKSNLLGRINYVKNQLLNSK